MRKIIMGLALAAAVTTASASNLYKPCAGCHGADGGKKALGKSAVIKGWSSAKTAEALKGYKAGTYGGPMKGVMKGQVARLNDAQIKELADYIAGL